MAGLRQRQKADRHDRILQAAAAMFREAGYGAVRIEDIAARAELSVGTLYNYFETKGELLLAIVTMEVEEVLAQGQAVLEAPPPSVGEALALLVGGYYDHSLVYLSKEMWRTAMALSIEAPDTPFSKRYTELDRLLTGQLCDLMARLQRRGLLQPGVDTRALGEMLFNTVNQMFIEFVKDDAMTVATLQAQVARQIAPLARLLSPA